MNQVGSNPSAGPTPPPRSTSVALRTSTSARGGSDVAARPSPQRRVLRAGPRARPWRRSCPAARGRSLTQGAIGAGEVDDVETLHAEVTGVVSPRPRSSWRATPGATATSPTPAGNLPRSRRIAPSLTGSAASAAMTTTPVAIARGDVQSRAAVGRHGIAVGQDVPKRGLDGFRSAGDDGAGAVGVGEGRTDDQVGSAQLLCSELGVGRLECCLRRESRS